jgi:hypothetical protein
MYRLRQLFGHSTGASVALATAMAIVIVSCSTSPTNPVSPSATTPDATSASAGGIHPTTTNSTSPSPTPPATPSPSPEGTGRFTGGGHVTQEPEGKITYGLTIHCDLILSNNLEINWGSNNGPGANNFHLNIHETTVECSDTIPNPSQPPPAAPLDTLTGTGTGTFNGVSGFSITFTFIDGGEPGGDDQIAFVITGPGGVVLNVPTTTVSGGNLQAHFDQPHK